MIAEVVAVAGEDGSIRIVLAVRAVHPCLPSKVVWVYCSGSPACKAEGL